MKKLMIAVGGAAMLMTAFAAEEWTTMPEVMGRKYWTMMEDIGIKGLPDRAVFTDCARYYGIPNPKLPDGYAAFSTIAENYAGGTKNYLYKLMEEDETAKGKPIVLYLSAKRRAFSNRTGKLELNWDDYREFLARHPNFLAFSTLDEWGNDLWSAARHLDKMPADVVKAYYEYEPTKEGVLQMYMKYGRRLLELNYSDAQHCSALRGLYCIDHVAASIGASLLGVETTNTSFGDEENRWDLQAAWTRGASRQFGNLPWNWFVAIYYIGFKRDGNYIPDSVCQCNPLRGISSTNGGEKGGVSPSLFNRACYYAYLNGATLVQTEQWFDHLLTTNAVGKLALSDRGEMFAKFHDFANAHKNERGIPYTPVAILTPFNQGYMSWGSCPWRRPDKLAYTAADHCVDGVFFSIVPGFKRWEALKRGEEGCLHNTPMAMMYDVLVPDALQTEQNFNRVLAHYQAAVVVGEYSDAAIARMKRIFAKYLEDGGKLAMPKAIARRMYGEDVPKCVYVSETEWMTPEMGADGAKAVAETLNGTRTFPETKRILSYFQKKYFPFTVNGECLFGANKTEKGWWFWAINNSGVTKLADEFQQVDETKTSTINVKAPEGCNKVRELLTDKEIEVKDGSFTYTIPAGGVAIFDVVVK